jgi:hypothetical protein
LSTNDFIFTGLPSNNSYFECPAGYAGYSGDEISFSIHAIDFVGNSISFGGDHFVVLISGPSVVIPQIIDHNNGTYTCQVCPKVPGIYTVEVRTLTGQHVLNSPCQFHIIGRYSPEHSFAIGYETAESCDLSPSSFTIQARSLSFILFP